MNLKITILVLDDDPEELELTKLILENVKVHTLTFFDDERLFIQALNRDVNVAIIDNYIKGAAMGLKLMQEIKKKCPKAKIIIVSGVTDERMAINYINEGIFKFLNKNDRHYQVKLYDYVHEAVKDARETLEFIEELQEIAERSKEVRSKPLGDE